MIEKIETLHPDPDKSGVNIDRGKYEQMRTAILDAIRKEPGITFAALTEAVGEQLAGGFEGSVSWYLTTVKLDLEARGLVERMPGRGPQRLQLAGSARQAQG